MANDIKISVWLTESVLADLSRVCDADDRPISAYVRRLIERDIDEKLVPSERVSKGRLGSTGTHTCRNCSDV